MDMQGHYSKGILYNLFVVLENNGSKGPFIYLSELQAVNFHSLPFNLEYEVRNSNPIDIVALSHFIGNSDVNIWLFSFYFGKPNYKIYMS